MANTLGQLEKGMDQIKKVMRHSDVNGVSIWKNYRYDYDPDTDRRIEGSKRVTFRTDIHLENEGNFEEEE